MNDTLKPKNGGVRPGAGRPKGESKTLISLRLSDAEIAAAEKLGGGNRHEGIRRALAAASVAAPTTASP